LQVTLDVSLPPESAVLLAEDRGREVRARGEVIEKRLGSEARRLRCLDGREEALPGRDQSANGFQKPVLGPSAVQEEHRRRHSPRVRLFHQIREPVQFLRVPPQVLQDFDVTFQRFGHEDFSSFRPASDKGLKLGMCSCCDQL